MIFTKKLDRAVQWAGEKMGSEAKTAQSEEFQRLEAEITLRQEGMENLHKATTIYSKWIGRRCDTSEDKSRGLPSAFLGRTMENHGREFEPDSEFGNSLISIGRANERIANLHNNFTEDVNANWLHHLDRNVNMMKDYQSARKKLESRRLAYDASVAKMQKAKRDDFRIEEEMRVSKTKFDDSSEDVMRRMQDIQDSESESVAALNAFLEAQLNYHERAAEELRRVQQSLVEGSRSTSPCVEERRITRSRSNTARSWQDSRQASSDRLSPSTDRLPIRRLASSHTANPPSLPPPSQSPRQSLARATSNYGTSTPLATINARVPSIGRTTSDNVSYGRQTGDVFRDNDSTASEDDSAGWGNRSASSATSYDSLCREPSSHEVRKAKPPPPPINRAKKPPPPPVPARRVHLGH